MLPAAMSDPYERNLGVLEAITTVRDQCPSGAVRASAERALEAIKTGGPDALREQAYFVHVAIMGWRGERASQVSRSLKAFLDSASPKSDPA